MAPTTKKLLCLTSKSTAPTSPQMTSPSLHCMTTWTRRLCSAYHLSLLSMSLPATPTWMETIWVIKATWFLNSRLIKALMSTWKPIPHMTNSPAKPFQASLVRSLTIKSNVKLHRLGHLALRLPPPMTVLQSQLITLRPSQLAQLSKFTSHEWKTLQLICISEKWGSE